LERHVLLQETILDKPVDSNQLLTTHKLCERSEYSKEVWESIKSFQRKLQKLFPGNLYGMSHRVNSPKDFVVKQQANGSRAYFDTVGFRLVSKNPLGLIQAAECLHQSSLQVLFRFNTYPFSKTDYLQRVGVNSSTSYRAIHYYISLGTVIAEVQIHTASIEVWSQIHHRTLYKPTKRITTTDHKGITALGEIANIVDLTGLLGDT
jgi:hypothetical protein